MTKIIYKVCEADKNVKISMTEEQDRPGMSLLNETRKDGGEGNIWS